MENTFLNKIYSTIAKFIKGAQCKIRQIKGKSYKQKIKQNNN